MKKYTMPTDCCTHYHGSNTFYLGYAMLPCFKVAICQDCGEATFVCGGFTGWLFEMFFAPFWRGAIKVRRDKTYTRTTRGELLEVKL